MLLHLEYSVPRLDDSARPRRLDKLAVALHSLHGCLLFLIYRESIPYVLEITCTSYLNCYQYCCSTDFEDSLYDDGYNMLP